MCLPKLHGHGDAGGELKWAESVQQLQWVVQDSCYGRGLTESKLCYASSQPEEKKHCYD